MKRAIFHIPPLLKKFILSIAFIIVLSNYNNGQNLSLNIYNYKNGLPSNYIFNATQDKLGYIWVGTLEGLSRFDGSNFTNFGLSDGLPGLSVLGGFMDSRYRFWVYTSKGAGILSGNRITNFLFSDKLPITWISQIIETRTGKIWVLTNAGVYEFQNNIWKKIQLFPGYENYTCSNILENEEGMYINYGTIIILKKAAGDYKIIAPQKKPDYYYLNLYSVDGNLFVNTIEGIYSINQYQLKKMPGQTALTSGIYFSRIDSKRRCWIAKAGVGIKLAELKNPDSSTLLYKGEPDFLPQNISEDAHGNIWVATGNGLMCFSEKAGKSYNLQAITGSNIIRNLIQPHHQPLFVNDGSLMSYVHFNGNFEKKVLVLKGAEPLPKNELIIDRYTIDNEGTLWYILRGLVLARQNGNNIYVENKTFYHLGNEAWDVIFDTYRNQLLISVKGKKVPCAFINNKFNELAISGNKPKNGNITRLHQSINGNILFATSTGDVYSINKKNQCRLLFNKEAAVLNFYNGNADDVWIIFQGKGIINYRWVKDSLQFHTAITKLSGLTTESIQAMCIDNNQRIWLCSNHEIFVYSKNNENHSPTNNYTLTGHFDAFNLEHSDGYNAKLTKDNKGLIWFFAERSLVCFNPDNINFKRSPPTIQIEKIELNLKSSQKENYQAVFGSIFNVPQNLTLPYSNNTLGIYFKGIYSTGSSGIKYTYILEGVTKDWSTPSKNDYVSFIKLPPGKYIFKVKAKLPNSSWSQPAAFVFTIKKPFWLTIWFLTLCISGITAILFFLLRYRMNQKIKLFEIRSRISQDLHDDIGASLSGISLLTQMANTQIDEKKTTLITDYLLKIKNHTQDVMEKLSDMVWLINPQNETIEKLLLRIKNYSTPIAVSLDIQMHFLTENHTSNLSISERRVVYNISKEAINNAFKYASCKHIFYTFSVTEKKCTLIIKDDGIGFIAETEQQGNGIKNMQAQALEIKAKLNITSTPGQGTVIELQF